MKDSLKANFGYLLDLTSDATAPTPLKAQWARLAVWGGVFVADVLHPSGNIC